MGLVDTIKHAMFHTGGDGEQEKPAAAHFKTAPGTIYAPVTGTVVTLNDINDETISKGLFGQGVGIVPEVGVIYAPASGRISAATVTNHAIGLTAKGGIDVLIHIGLDTVNMEGEGFQRFVEPNQEVKAGEPLLVFDRDAIKKSGYEDVVTIVVSNNDAFASIDNISDSNTMIAGHPLVKVGDPILFVSNE